MVEGRSRRLRPAQVEVAEAVWEVVGRPGLQSLLQDLDDLYSCERCQRIVDTQTEVAIAVSVEVSDAPGSRTHQPMVTHAACASSQVRPNFDQLGNDRDPPALQGARFGVTAAVGGPTDRLGVLGNHRASAVLAGRSPTGPVGQRPDHPGLE